MPYRNPRRIRLDLIRAGRIARRAARNPYFRRANAVASALQAGIIARRAYTNYKRKQATKRYREVPFTTNRVNKKRKITKPAAKRMKNLKKFGGTMTTIKACKAGKKLKVPKGAMQHYKDYGMYSANKCMYLNHMHMGHEDRFWYAIASGLTKYLLGKSGLRMGKFVSDPVIGPLTDGANIDNTEDQSTSWGYYTHQWALTFASKKGFDDETYTTEKVFVPLTSNTTTYKTFETLAYEVKIHLLHFYANVSQNPADGRIDGDNELQFNQNELRGQPVYWLQNAAGIGYTTPVPLLHSQGPQTWFEPNMAEAMLSVSVKTVIKMQNVTPGDTYETAGVVTAIDTNPLIGRMYCAKGNNPQVDPSLALAGSSELDNFFGSAGDPNAIGPTSLYLCGAGVTKNPISDETGGSTDLSMISNIPPAPVIYGNRQTVKTSKISFPVGSEKFHTTTFTLKRTFKSLSDISNWRARSKPGNLNGNQGDGIMFDSVSNTFDEEYGRHTLFGLVQQHRHGNDVIKIGYQVDSDYYSHVKPVPKVYPAKAVYTIDHAHLGYVNTVDGGPDQTGNELKPKDIYPPTGV